MFAGFQGLVSVILTAVICVGSLSAADSPAQSYVSLVDPFIGTGGNRHVCANNPPAATAPFGLVRLGPDTVSAGGATATNMSGYYFHDDRILGFSHTRLCGTGAIDGGHFRVTPVVASRPLNDLRGTTLRFDHNDETASAGYYSVRLPDQQVLAEMTATRRTGRHRYTFDAGAEAGLLLDVGSALGKGTSSEGVLQLHPETQQITGSIRTFGSFSGRFGGLQVWFAAHIHAPWKSGTVWQNDEVLPDHQQAAGDDVGVLLTFPKTAKPQVVEITLALSHVSLANAQENLRHEAGQLSFEDIRQAATAKWESRLAQLPVSGGTQADRTIFYTALYRSMMMPSTFSDTNGQYTGFDGQVHQAKDFTYYTDMSLWDTFRTTHPLYTLIAPAEHRDMLRSLVAMGEQGGSLPRWPSGTGYTNSMFGAPAEIVISEAWQKGIQDFDVESAWQIIERTSNRPAPEGSAWSGRRGLKEYLQYGYCPSETMSKAVAKTLEYATTDAAIARLAAALDRPQAAAEFSRRAQNYRNLWNPQTRFFQPKDSQGRFSTPHKPTLLTYFDFSGTFTDDYCEGSAWQWRWSVAHDADGLVQLFSDPEYFAEQLNHFFENAPAGIGQLPNGYYWQGNQPDLHAVYLFNAAGRPDLTQKWVRWILQHKHDTSPIGLDGNDDGGTLSAWYVFSSLGLYPIPGTDRYHLGSPLWQRATLPTNGAPLEIVAQNYAPDRYLVRQVLLNGRSLNRTWISHEELSGGGTLTFVMDDR